MSRSYRLPYAYIVSGHSSQDKVIAARSYRRLLKRSLELAVDFEEYVPPTVYEAPYNDRWSWYCDGDQRLQTIWNNSLTEVGLGNAEDLQWNIEYIEKCKRK